MKRAKSVRGSAQGFFLPVPLYRLPSSRCHWSPSSDVLSRLKVSEQPSVFKPFLSILTHPTVTPNSICPSLRFSSHRLEILKSGGSFSSKAYQTGGWQILSHISHTHIHVRTHTRTPIQLGHRGNAGGLGCTPGEGNGSSDVGPECGNCVEAEMKPCGLKKVTGTCELINKFIRKCVQRKSILFKTG